MEEIREWKRDQDKKLNCGTTIVQHHANNIAHILTMLRANDIVCNISNVVQQAERSKK